MPERIGFACAWLVGFVWGAHAVVAQDMDRSRVVSTPRVMPVWLGGALTFHVNPEIRFRAGRLVGDASALLGGGRQQPRRMEGQIVAAFGIPTISALRLEAEVGAFDIGHGPDVRANGVEGAVRFMRQDDGGSVWVGGSLASSWDDETTRRARTILGGVWKAFGSTGLGLSLRAVEYDEEVVLGRDTTYLVLGFPFTSRRTEQIVFDHYYLDAEVIASHQVGSVSLYVEGGGRLTRRSVRERRTWIRGGIEIPILRDLSLQIAAGQRQNMPEARIEAGSFASIGVAIELGRVDWMSEPEALPDDASDAPSTELRALGEGDRWELFVRNLHASRVDIMGDPTNWHAVEMEVIASATWRVVLRMRPGTHRMNIRINGGVWEELPGYPTARDEFGGVVGVIVIEGPDGT